MTESSQTSVFIRDYQDVDIPLICEIIKAAFAEYQGLLNPPSSAEKKSPEVVAEELKTRDALVATRNNELVACVFYQLKADTVYIDRLSVLPGHRKQGIASKLMHEVEARAKQTDARALSLSVRLVLKQQQAYYQSLGFVFESYGTHAGFDSPTFMNMYKLIVS